MKSKTLQSRAGTEKTSAAKRDAGDGARWPRLPVHQPLRAGKTYTLLDAEGSGMVRRIWFTFPPNDPMAMLHHFAHLLDGQEQPSVEVPMGDFFRPAAR